MAVEAREAATGIETRPPSGHAARRAPGNAHRVYAPPSWEPRQQSFWPQAGNRLVAFISTVSLEFRYPGSPEYDKGHPEEGIVSCQMLIR